MTHVFFLNKPKPLGNNSNILTSYKKHLIMKKIFLLIISAFLFNTVIAQNSAIKITNVNTNKEKIIKENKRIKLKTSDGRKIKGRFKIENNNTIIIDNVRINFTDIDELKRNPLLTSTLTSGFLLYSGVLIAGISILVAVFVEPAVFLFTIPAAGMIYAGIKPPNFNKNYKIEKGWKFEIISLPD